MTENEPNDLMAEFRKLQKETVGIRSAFAEKLPFSFTNMMEHKLIKDLHNLCEKAVKRQDDQNEINKNLIEELRQIRKEASETKKIQQNQEQILDKILAEFQSVRKELEETKKMQAAQNQEMKQVQNELRMSPKNPKTINEPKKRVVAVMNPAKFQSIRKESAIAENNQQVQNQAMKRPFSGPRMPSENKKMVKVMKDSVIPTSCYQIFARINGSYIALTVKQSTTIKDLTTEIGTRVGISRDRIWLSYDVKALNEVYDNRTLYDLSIGPESTIQVGFRPSR